MEWNYSIITFYVMLLVLAFYITIPLTILFGWLWYKAIRQGMNMRKPVPVIAVLLTLYLLIDFLLVKFPSSI